MKISALYELPVSEQNLPVIGIVAKELGYDGVIGTPEEYIERHFADFFDNIRNKVESGLTKYYGEAGSSTTQAILGLYDSEVIKNITIE